MQFFPIGRTYDFMKYRVPAVAASALLCVVSAVLLFVPGPKLSTDFVGGTEVEVAFEGQVTPSQIQQVIEAKGFSRPDVIHVDDEKNPHRYLIRVQEVSTVADSVRAAVESKLCLDDKPRPDCQNRATEVKFSPGGEKVSVRFDAPPDLEWVRAQVASVSGVQVRPGANNPTLQSARDNRVDVALTSLGDQMMAGLRQGLPQGVTPDQALRTEWIGPKAGAQLRDAAIKSVLISLFFIMAYVALRFDIRFAPGGVIALAHDALGTVGILIMMGRELSLITVAAVLTIIGFSVNDTVVIYDRVREHMARSRGESFSRLINVSLSETLSRTILTSSTVIMVLLCFFIWGTGSLKDFALTLIIGMLLGVYSSIYVALPITEVFDRRFLNKSRKAAAST
ncbi:MAG TPA: protein translocase subunit SecF [Polyangiaceae bacterium]|nr:protein translocase subunit SecF [Polyangiaceae bacterium]